VQQALYIAEEAEELAGNRKNEYSVLAKSTPTTKAPLIDDHCNQHSMNKLPTVSNETPVYKISNLMATEAGVLTEKQQSPYFYFDSVFLTPL
jgi:hypothetical protein